MTTRAFSYLVPGALLPFALLAAHTAAAQGDLERGAARDAANSGRAAFDAGHGGAWRVRLSGGVTTQLVPNVKGDVSYLAVGGNALYFTGNIQVVQNPVTYSTAILRAPLPNGLATGSLPKFVDINNVSSMVADDQHLYFTDYGNPSNARH